MKILYKILNLEIYKNLNIWKHINKHTSICNIILCIFLFVCVSVRHRKNDGISEVYLLGAKDIEVRWTRKLRTPTFAVN